jgi:hypothetical protein
MSGPAAALNKKIAPGAKAGVQSKNKATIEALAAVATDHADAKHSDQSDFKHDVSLKSASHLSTTIIE